MLIAAIVGLMVFLLMPKKSDPPATARIALPFAPAMVLPPELEAFAKALEVKNRLLEIKQDLLDQGIPVAAIEAHFAAILVHLQKDKAA